MNPFHADKGKNQNVRLNERYTGLANEINRRLATFPLSQIPSGLYEPIRYSLIAKGKRMRPILLILVGESLGASREKLFPAALAIELLHTFTLVHDDIMDKDTQRRGRPTLHIKWDDNTAILAGDALMTLAFRTLMQTKSPAISRMGVEFSQAMLEICEGQAMDMEFEKRSFVDAEEYLQMVGKKTGKLLGLSCVLGALIADPASESIADLADFGLKLGQAFQIQDDCLEITSDEQKMGKSLFSDIAEGKKTFPVIQVLADLSVEKRDSFLSFLKQNSDDRAIIRSEFEKRGALEKSLFKVRQLLNEASDLLSKMPINVQTELSDFIQTIYLRQS
ncbi:MAG: polyprenyl synthetase family protein [Candidatus Marinimicrobia bacterium]|nr:polyprenyl synthetase family protein [Candidatus Neomarinimicrobiota bacterium]